MISQIQEVAELSLRFFLSTIGTDSAYAARKYGLGLEIAQYCTAANMDTGHLDAQVKQDLTGISGRLFHAPFNELFPCAVDPQARQLAIHRYRQAIRLAREYGAEKVIIHGGFNPYLYYPIWYTEQSIAFWKDFLEEDPGVELVLENVLEPEPELMKQIVSAVNHPRLRLCLDVGHVNAYASRNVLHWVEVLSPWLSHFHLHNNDGSWDTHSPLMTGTIPMEALLREIGEHCPEATVTLELQETEPSVQWLRERNYL